MTRLRTLAVALALGLTAVTLPGAAATGPAAAGVSDSKIRVVQHNTDMGGPGSAVAEASSWGDVDAITFQELCQSQIPEVSSAGYEVMWRKQIQAPDCPPTANGKRWKGNAIATARGLGTEKVTPLGTYGGRDFKLLCAKITRTGVSGSWVCTSHLALGYSGAPNGTRNRTTQARKIAARLGPWIADGRKVVLTGDFNDNPKSTPIDALHRVKRDGTVGTNGKFWEGDQSDNSVCGGDGLCRAMEVTTDPNRKGTRRALDYFFAGYRGVDAQRGLSKGVIDSATAGHWIVRGQVKFGS